MRSTWHTLLCCCLRWQQGNIEHREERRKLYCSCAIAYIEPETWVLWNKAASYQFYLHAILKVNILNYFQTKKKKVLLSLNFYKH